MKKLFLLVVILAFAGTTQAQQAVVQTPEAPQNLILGKDQAPAMTIEQQYLPMNEPLTYDRARSTNNTLSKSDPYDLFEIGLMANTYAMIGDNRVQIACNPTNDNVAVIFRGNDRSSSGDGNTLYIRYSTDAGATWTPQGDNIATTASPRYPNIFLPTTGSPSTAVLWPQVVQFGDGSSAFGDVYSMKSDIGNGNPSYGTFTTPPNWSIPWQIIEDQTTGELFTLALALEPANGASTGELFVIRSTDAGASWAAMTFDNPAYTSDLIPNGYFGGSLRLEISPDGSTMIVAFPLIIESEPGRAFLLDENHEIAWRVSTDKGATWGELQRVSPAGDAILPDPLSNKCEMSWDFDLTIDYKNEPHFLTVLSADLNPFTPFDEAPTDSTINLIHVDSTFASEITKIDGQWTVFPIGPARRVRTDRASFTAGSTDDSPTVFRNEPKWARSLDGKKIYAKWISSIFSWRIANVAGTPTLFADSLHQVYVNGRHVDSKSHTSAWTNKWDYTNPDNNTFEMDSLMRATALEDVDAKYTKIARYAGDDGRLHIIFIEWGVGETVDDDPVFTDQVVWYLQNDDVVVSVPNVASVEQIDSRPGAFDLHQNYPNPFNPTTEISFTLPASSHVSLRVYNLLGQEVASLVDEYRSAGTHSLTFDASDLSTGMYIYRLESSSNSVSRKMMLSK